MALSFNGSTGYLQWDAGTMPVTTYPFSVVCWMSIAGGASFRHAAMLQSSSNTYFSTVGASGGAAANAQEYDGANFHDPQYTGSPTIGTSLVLVVGVFASTTSAKTYLIDSSRVGTDTNTITSRVANYDRITIGARNAGGSLMQHLQGDVAEVHIYNTALSTTNVDAIAALEGTSTGPESITGWVDGWHLKDTSSLSSIGGTRTLTLIGGVTNSAATHPITGRGGGGSATGAAAHYYRQMQ